MAKKDKLGASLLDTMEDVVSLIEVTHDPDRLDELDELRVKLSKQISVLIDVHLDAAADEYKAATQGLQQASSTIDDAIKGLESVANAIVSAGKALDLVAKVAAA